MNSLVLLLALLFVEGEKVKLADNVVGKIIKYHHKEEWLVKGKVKWYYVWQVGWFDVDHHKQTDLFYEHELEHAD
jgi:beta-lactamase class D